MSRRRGAIRWRRSARRWRRFCWSRELALAEINPLFVSDSGCVAGDAKVVVDLNAVDRQPAIASMIAARPAIYADACRKIAEGFDYVELDPDGEIGLVTTGAGLSMMLIDELTARGAKPLNFCDIRTGQMRGSPARLIRVLEWITVAAVVEGRAGQYLCRDHRSWGVRRTAGGGDAGVAGRCVFRSWPGWSDATRRRRNGYCGRRNRGCW